MLHVSRKGFTLIELLVSVSIFVIITGMVVANFRAGSRNDELRISAQALVSDLRKAQNMALAGELVNDISPPGGYGVYFNIGTPDRYIIFADLDGELDYDIGEAISGGTIILPEDVVITSIQPLVISSAIFKPPKPTIYINGGTDESTFSVTLTHALNNQTRQVVVKRISGQIGLE